MENFSRKKSQVWIKEEINIIKEKNNVEKEKNKSPRVRWKTGTKQPTNEELVHCVKANVFCCLFSYRLLALHFSSSKAKLKG